MIQHIFLYAPDSAVLLYANVILQLTESKSLQATCQAFAAVSYLTIGDADSSSKVLWHFWCSELGVYTCLHPLWFVFRHLIWLGHSMEWRIHYLVCEKKLVFSLLMVSFWWSNKIYRKQGIICSLGLLYLINMSSRDILLSTKIWFML